MATLASKCQYMSGGCGNLLKLAALPQCGIKVRSYGGGTGISGQSTRAASATPKPSERARAATSFYEQHVIDEAASKTSVRLMPATMLYSGKSADGSHILRSCQYLHKELPVRLAQRIKDFRQLPFIVGCNPTILQIHELYIKAFRMVADFPQVCNMEEEQRFCEMLTELLHEHRDIITLLAEGFAETRKHIKDENVIQSFLDKTLTARLGTRLLCEHHLMLHQEQANQIGIIQINFCPKTLVERKAEITRKLCEEKYGVSPEVRITGHLSARFSYISQPIDYVVLEMLKNAMRATVEHQGRSPTDRLPAVVVTISNNPVDFIIRISDRGGGVPHDLLPKIWNYGYSCSSSRGSTSTGSSISYETTATGGGGGGLFDAIMNNRSFGSLFGYGFGLPACRAYVEYLGGELSMETLQGYGTDVFIRLRHIDGKMESFRI